MNSIQTEPDPFLSERSGALPTGVIPPLKISRAGTIVISPSMRNARLIVGTCRHLVLTAPVTNTSDVIIGPLEWDGGYCLPPGASLALDFSRDADLGTFGCHALTAGDKLSYLVIS